MIIKTAIIRKEKGKYILYSRKKNPKTGKRRRLGISDTLEGIKKREKQVQFFKFHCLDQNDRDKETKSLSLVSDAAQYLENAGYIKAADKIYLAMDHIGKSLEDNLVDHDFIPSAQMNTENEGTYGDLGLGPGTFSVPEAEKLASVANELDKKGLYDEANVIDEMLYAMASVRNIHDIQEDIKIIKKVQVLKSEFEDGTLGKLSHNRDILNVIADKMNMNIRNRQNGGFICGLAVAMHFIHPNEAFGDLKYYQAAAEILNDPKEALEGCMEDLAKVTYKDEDEMNNVDILSRLNGLSGTSVIDSQNSGQFSGLSDSYFYSTYDNSEGPYWHNKITI